MKDVDPVEAFGRLAARARAETAPSVNVAGQVLQRIRSARPDPERALTLLAACSCAVAVLVVLAGWEELSTTVDPLGALLQIVPPIGF